MLDFRNSSINGVLRSLRKDSFNRKLANAIAKFGPPAFSFKQLEIGDLPLYNQDDDVNQAESVKRLKTEIAAANDLLFVTPEHNRSMPRMLKNAIDHASRPYGQNARAGKPEAFTHAKDGFFDEAGNIDADSKKFLQTWMDQYVTG